MKNSLISIVLHIATSSLNIKRASKCYGMNEYIYWVIRDECVKNAETKRASKLKAKGVKAIVSENNVKELYQ